MSVPSTYTDTTTGKERTGCFDPEAGRLTVLDEGDAIVAHFRCSENYVIGLDYSTYDRGDD